MLEGSKAPNWERMVEEFKKEDEANRTIPVGDTGVEVVWGRTGTEKPTIARIEIRNLRDFEPSSTEEINNLLKGLARAIEESTKNAGRYLRVDIVPRTGDMYDLPTLLALVASVENPEVIGDKIRELLSTSALEALNERFRMMREGNVNRVLAEGLLNAVVLEMIGERTEEVRELLNNLPEELRRTLADSESLKRRLDEGLAKLGVNRAIRERVVPRLVEAATKYFPT